MFLAPLQGGLRGKDGHVDGGSTAPADAVGAVLQTGESKLHVGKLRFNCVEPGLTTKRAQQILPSGTAITPGPARGTATAPGTPAGLIFEARCYVVDVWYVSCSRQLPLIVGHHPMVALGPNEGRARRGRLPLPSPASQG